MTTTPEERQVVRCDVRLLDEDGLVSIEHNLGTMDVRVVLYGKDGTILTARMLAPIDENTVEGILSEEPAYALVTLAEDEEDEEQPATAAPAARQPRSNEVTLKDPSVGVRTGPLSWS